MTRLWLAIVLMAATPLWCQVNAGANGTTDAAVTADDSRMTAPPPVSGESYPTGGLGDTRSNYLRYGLTFSTAYIDNTIGGPTPVSDISYSVSPTIALDKSIPRLHLLLTYSPGFTFYQRFSRLDAADQNVGINVGYRLSQHVSVNFADTFQKSSSVFNQPDFTSANPVSGSPEPPTQAVIAPLAEQLTNTASTGLTYQYAANSMVGVSGRFSDLHFPNSEEVPGLYDSSSVGGSAFYDHRLSRKQHLGVSYQYSRILAYPSGAQSQTETHSIYLSYTFYVMPRLSISVSGGPQYSSVAQSPQPAFTSWTPAVTASMGWQGHRASFAASYSRMVTAGGGLVGAFHSNTANASAHWQIARTWSVGSGASYAIYENLTPFFFLSNTGGHSVSGSVSIQHPIGEHFSANVGYTRLHQSYGGIAIIANTPDTNRESITISYRFARPLGR